ncbi:hypothetical protein [Nonomuraea typhae]|uniref:hypothetical protein n=1 Tax=Nonomuraea typhae TaxID=2603600 RepID=UPI0012FC8AC5|nr:hypothetical protein [Nonomuraea typhae]
MSTKGVAIVAALIAAGATITAALITSGQLKFGGAPDTSETRRGGVSQPQPQGQKRAPQIVVRPKSLDLCGGAGCAQEVLILSTGNAMLKVTDIEFQGESAGSFRHDGACENQSLDAGAECVLKVWFEPETAGASGSAVLVIHQNLRGDNGTRVQVNGQGQLPTTEPTPSELPTSG